MFPVIKSLILLVVLTEFPLTMFITVTSLELKTPLKFFALSYNALQIIKQLKSTPCLKYKSTGFWTKHYTLSAWNTLDDLKAFYKSGAHLSAMQKSANIAKCIQTYTFESTDIPSWKDAKKRLIANGKSIRF